MPKSNIFFLDNAIADVGKTLAAWQRHRDYDNKRMGIGVHVSERTWARRKSTPKEITIEELWRACNLLKIPHDEAVAMLIGGLDTVRFGQKKGGIGL
jgi:hypothetical protein